MTYPKWTHTDHGHNGEPTTICVEPSFRDDLGVVFLHIQEGDKRAGMWLGPDRLAELRAALDAAEAHNAANAGR